MKPRYSHLMLAIAGAASAVVVMPFAVWVDISGSLLTLLSIIAGAVLLRLARGMPPIEAEAYDLEGARKLAEATKAAVRALRALFAVVLTTAFLVVFLEPIADVGRAALEELGWAMSLGGMFGSGVLGFLVAFVLVRTASVVQADIGIVDLQANAFVNLVLVKRRGPQAKAASPTRIAVRNPDDYGKVLEGR